MENIHGIDVSWMHRPSAQKDQNRNHAPSSPGLSRDMPPPRSHNEPPQSPPKQSAPIAVPQSARVASEPSTSSVSPSASTPSRTPPRRPTLLSRNDSERGSNGEPTRQSRRNSWMTSISSKFSSSNQAPQSPGLPSPPQTSRPQINGTNAGTSPTTAKERITSPPPNGQKAEAEEFQPYVPQKPKEATSSFFSSITRRLSTSSQGGLTGRPIENGGVCPRRVLNVDFNRERCLVPELDSAKLRRVSFSVDVEIAGGPRYKDDDDTATKQKKNKDKKIKERAEGEALKHPQAVAETKEKDGSNTKETALESVPEADSEKPQSGEGDAKEVNHRKEKKKRSEEERKERKERRRRKAEEDGSIPVELTREDSTNIPKSLGSTPSASGTVTPRPQDRPTTDPVRVYRRCCQLRESPILKRITEQLMSPTCTMSSDPGVVTCLDLTGSRMQLADVITLGDWLAIVPVKRLLLEDADLTDEGVRVILAGLLAAKKPEPTKRRTNGKCSPRLNEERSGIVEKVTLKNNPKITKVGWKHIACFIYMCRSVKAIDLSMIKFPSTIPPSTCTPTKPPERAPVTTGQPVDAAETMYKALAGRRGGARLEELIMAECGLDAKQIRKIVDGATMCGITRLSLASNHLDDEGFEHILHYVRSGVCQIIDLGGNDLRGRLGLLADALTHNPNCPVWGLSLAGCNIDTSALKLLFPALSALPNFRFLDLSHNTELFEGSNSALHLLRRYIPKMQHLKRLHLMDVGLTAQSAIALAEVLPEGPVLAHLNILENAPLTALVNQTDAGSQEEACALYAALMAAVRVSNTIICIDVDVPHVDTNEVVKALAKQVVAYCLRNMDLVTIPDASTTPEAATLTKPHGVADPKEVTVPDVLLHLVGHVEGFHENHDLDDPAPDEDYIVGGTGVVKALQYCLGEKAFEIRRGSFPRSGTVTPSREESAGMEQQRKGKAKEMSKNLLGSARKIRARLQPALVKEAANGDEMAYRRLLFLDQTLQGMIQRFEDEYPETRLAPPSPKHPASVSSSLGSVPSSQLPESSVATLATETSALSMDSDPEDDIRPRGFSRHNSDVSLAGRALALEEGRIHRLGQQARRDVLNAPSASNSRPGSAAGPGAEAEAAAAAAASEAIAPHLSELSEKLENISGEELKGVVERDGWQGLLEQLGANFEELRQLQEKDPQGWEQFKESQLKARANIGRLDEAPTGV